jgi:hypothetical protein
VLVMKARCDASLVEEHPNEALISGVLCADPLEHDMAFEALNAFGTPQQDVRHPPRR